MWYPYTIDGRSVGLQVDGGRREKSVSGSTPGEGFDGGRTRASMALMRGKDRTPPGEDKDDG